MEFKEECDICGKEDSLVDAIYEKNSVRLCSFCRTLPDVLLIEKPTSDQIRRVYERYSFTAKAKQQIQSRKLSIPPSGFRGYTIEDLRQRKKEQQAQETEEKSVPEETKESDVI
jgi:hypothetical protein